MGRRARIFLLAGLSLCAPLYASEQLDEEAVKAATLFNVALFVDWPIGATKEPFVIGVAVDDVLAAAVANVTRGRRLHDREIRVHRLGRGDENCDCQILFVGLKEDGRSRTLLRSVRGNPVLTIGETTAFLREGGVVRIFRDHDRLRLQINSRAATDAGLQISSRLQQLAAKTP